MLRRLKENVNIKLPSRKEVTFLVPLTQTQIELYKKLLLVGLDDDAIDIILNNEKNNEKKNSYKMDVVVDSSMKSGFYYLLFILLLSF
jgi:SNF2 family DNA or RNA helicase